MSFSKIIGIDVSKLTLDVEVLPDGGSYHAENCVKGIKQLIRQLGKDYKIKSSEVLFAFEHTGFYSHQLAVQLQAMGYAFKLLPGLELKRSLGIARGKSDKVDALKIAEYVDLRRHKIIPTQLPDKVIDQMKQLLSLRDRLVRERAGYKTTLGEARRAISRKDNLLYFKTMEEMVAGLDLQIDRLDQKLLDLVKCNPELEKQFNLIISIKGVGPQTALNMIAVTEGFTKFPTWRKFACYSGIAPFPYQSGTSIRGRTKVSHLANKKMKAYEHLVISPYPKEYIYDFKLKNGKTVVIRPIRPEDEPLEAEMFTTFSKETTVGTVMC